MALPDWYIDQLEEDIVQLKEQLGPLESGKLHVGEKNVWGPHLDRTQARIDWLKRSIAELQFVVDKRDA